MAGCAACAPCARGGCPAVGVDVETTHTIERRGTQRDCDVPCERGGGGGGGKHTLSLPSPLERRAREITEKDEIEKDKETEGARLCAAAAR